MPFCFIQCQWVKFILYIISECDVAIGENNNSLNIIEDM